MRIGYGTYVTNPSYLDREVDAAAAAGFDAVLFSEHHGLTGYVPDPLAAATYVLGRAPSLRAGPMPIVLPLHDPLAVAERAALVDAVSGGRLRFGVAAGYLARDFEQRGLDLDVRGDALEEGTDVLRRIWRGELGPFHGTHVRIPRQEPLVPPPQQPGGPPVWMAAGTPAGTRRAARVADGIVVDSVRPGAGVAELADRFQQARVSGGHGPGTVAAMRRAWIGDADEVDRFVTNLQRELSSFATSAAGQSMPWFDAPGGGVSVDAVRARAAVGDGDEVVGQLRTLGDQAGVEYLIVKLQWTSGADLEVLLDQLARWAPVCAALHGG